MMQESGPSGSPLLDRLAALSWRILVIIALLAVVLYVLTRLQFVVLALFLAFFVVAVLSPLRSFLERHGVRHLLAVWAVIALAALVVVGLLAAVAVPFVIQADELVDNIIQGVNRLTAWLSEGPLQIPADEVEQYTGQLLTLFEENMRTWASGVIGTTMAGVEIAVSILLAVPMIFFFLKDSRSMNRWLLGWVALSRRDRVQEVMAAAWDRVGKFVRGTAAVATFDAVLIGVGLVILDIPLAGSLAVLTFVLAFIPIVGALAAGAAAVLVAFVTQGFTDALIVLGIVIVVQQLEGNVIAPLIVGRVVRLHPVVVLLAISIGGTLGGILGAFIAVPVTGFVYAIVAELREPDLAKISI